jgi:hypothetical protein
MNRAIARFLLEICSIQFLVVFGDKKGALAARDALNPSLSFKAVKLIVNAGAREVASFSNLTLRGIYPMHLVKRHNKGVD